MEFRKMLMITLYAEQKKKKRRHRFIEQSFRLCGRRRVWDVSREQHWNMYIIYGETDHQPRLDAWDNCSDLVHWENLEGMGGEGGGRGDWDGEKNKNKKIKKIVTLAGGIENSDWKGTWKENLGCW